jgi:hypothetical protein
MISLLHQRRKPRLQPGSFIRRERGKVRLGLSSASSRSTDRSPLKPAKSATALRLSHRSSSQEISPEQTGQKQVKRRTEVGMMYPHAEQHRRTSFLERSATSVVLSWRHLALESCSWPQGTHAATLDTRSLDRGSKTAPQSSVSITSSRRESRCARRFFWIDWLPEPNAFGALRSYTNLVVELSRTFRLHAGVIGKTLA